MSQDLFGKAEPIRKPPSLSFKTVNNYLESWNDKTIPSHIDRSVLPTSMSGGNQTYLQGALKFLGLVSENNVPEKLFHRLVETDKESKAAVWREIVTTAYDFLLQDLDIERATTRGVVDKFKEQGISGDSIRKAMIFF